MTFLDKHGWTADLAALIEWFLPMIPPTEPFTLYQGVRVVDPSKFWNALKSDITTGPDKARGMTGALEKDLRRLAVLFGGPRAL